MFKSVTFDSSSKGFPHFVYDTNVYADVYPSTHTMDDTTTKDSITQENQQPFSISVNNMNSIKQENIQPLPPSVKSIDEIFNNLDNLDFLNEKFDELREKEIDGHITESEKDLLYNVIEKAILKLPNPYLPNDHEEAMAVVKRFELLEKQLDKKR